MRFFVSYCDKMKNQNGSFVTWCDVCISANIFWWCLISGGGENQIPYVTEFQGTSRVFFIWAESEKHSEHAPHQWLCTRTGELVGRYCHITVTQLPVDNQCCRMIRQTSPKWPVLCCVGRKTLTQSTTNAIHRLIETWSRDNEMMEQVTRSKRSLRGLEMMRHLTSQPSDLAIKSVLGQSVEMWRLQVGLDTVQP